MICGSLWYAGPYLRKWRPETKKLGPQCNYWQLKNGVLYYIYYQVGGKFLDELHLMKK
jgi:hypothetical protein